MKKNICIIGLSNTFTKNIAKRLADRLEMFYADINELLKFDLLDVDQAKELTSSKYIQKLESKKIKTVASYENTVITLDYSALTNNDNYEIIKNDCLIIYLKTTKEFYKKSLQEQELTKSQKTININLYKDRDYISSKVSDIIIKLNAKNIDNVLDIIIKETLSYYNNKR